MHHFPISDYQLLLIVAFFAMFFYLFALFIEEKLHQLMRKINRSSLAKDMEDWQK